MVVLSHCRFQEVTQERTIMDNRKAGSAAGGGMGIFGVLTTIFVVLKLIDVIAWSWWWVLSPTLIALGLVMLFAIILIVISMIFVALEHLAKRKRKNDTK